MRIRNGTVGLVAGLAINIASYAQKAPQLNKIDKIPYGNICTLGKEKMHIDIYSAVSKSRDFKNFISSDTLTVESTSGKAQKAIIKIAKFANNKNTAYINILGYSNLYKIVGSDTTQGLTVENAQRIDGKINYVESNKAIDSILNSHNVSLPRDEKRNIIAQQQKLAIQYRTSQDSLYRLKTKTRKPEKKANFQNELNSLKENYYLKKDSLTDAYNDFFR